MPSKKYTFDSNIAGTVFDEFDGNKNRKIGRFHIDPVVQKACAELGYDFDPKSDFVNFLKFLKGNDDHDAVFTKSQFLDGMEALLAALKAK